MIRETLSPEILSDIAFVESTVDHKTLFRISCMGCVDARMVLPRVEHIENETVAVTDLDLITATSFIPFDPFSVNVSEFDKRPGLVYATPEHLYVDCIERLPIPKGEEKCCV